MIEFRFDRHVSIRTLKRLWDTCLDTAGRDPESIDLAWQNSAYVVHAWRGEDLIGMARTISDGRYFAAVCDVICAPDAPPHLASHLKRLAKAPFQRRGMTIVLISPHHAPSSAVKKTDDNRTSVRGPSHPNA
ncbi:MAG: hypothetical protein C7B44_02155 [Sulfobacillus thermosulfidooxidans]|nr:MAG: hypothetical protein C7B44_02155 [Sulfobacillus thermosulfidooxidans]